jgi:hypothetical protein
MTEVDDKFLRKVEQYFENGLRPIMELMNWCDWDKAGMCDVVVFYEQERSMFSYYLVNHTAMTVFWLEDVRAEDLGIVHGTGTLPTCRQKLETQLYWNHVELFPSHHATVDVKQIDKLKAMAVAATVG